MWLQWWERREPHWLPPWRKRESVVMDCLPLLVNATTQGTSAISGSMLPPPCSLPLLMTALLWVDSALGVFLLSVDFYSFLVSVITWWNVCPPACVGNAIMQSTERSVNNAAPSLETLFTPLRNCVNPVMPAKRWPSGWAPVTTTNNKIPSRPTHNEIPSRPTLSSFSQVFGWVCVCDGMCVRETVWVYECRYSKRGRERGWAKSNKKAV